MQRILILGCAGTGKSTLAVALGRKLGLPVIHLDAHFWHAGWVETPKAEWPAKVAALVQGDRWVMDGNYASTLAERLAACDTVVFLDRHRLVCLYRVLVRCLKFLGRTRPDMPENCPEKVDWEFLCWIWNYARDVKPVTLGLAREQAGARPVAILRSNREIAEFVRNAVPGGVE